MVQHKQSHGDCQKSFTQVCACHVYQPWLLLEGGVISFKSFGLCTYYSMVATIRGWRLFKEIRVYTQDCHICSWKHTVTFCALVVFTNFVANKFCYQVAPRETHSSARHLKCLDWKALTLVFLWQATKYWR